VKAFPNGIWEREKRKLDHQVQNHQVQSKKKADTNKNMSAWKKKV